MRLTLNKTEAAEILRLVQREIRELYNKQTLYDPESETSVKLDEKIELLGGIETELIAEAQVGDV